MQLLSSKKLLQAIAIIKSEYTLW